MLGTEIGASNSMTGFLVHQLWPVLGIMVIDPGGVAGMVFKRLR